MADLQETLRDIKGALRAPMNRHDLDELAELLSGARKVVAMVDIHHGERSDDVIGLRHDVDDSAAALATAVKMASWEASRGYRSTYFMLHTAPYWRNERRLRAALEQIAEHGHEIGIHANAVADSLRHGGDPASILTTAIERLRGYGFRVDGVAGHGDALCHQVGFISDEMFTECARPERGAPDRVLSYNGRRLQLQPLPLAHFGLIYETYRQLPTGGRYLSDSGAYSGVSKWNIPLKQIAVQPGQLHVLQHPDWWGPALRSRTTRSGRR
jgi:hypothetical protein